MAKLGSTLIYQSKSGSYNKKNKPNQPVKITKNTAYELVQTASVTPQARVDGTEMKYGNGPTKTCEWSSGIGYMSEHVCLRRRLL